MNANQIKKQLEGLEIELLKKSNKYPILLTREWVKEFPTNAGVYIVYDKKDGSICYVGETYSIRSRMSNLMHTSNHVIRRSIGNDIFKNYSGFVKATSKIKFRDDIELKLIKHIKNNYEVSYIIVEFGRKEFEDYLCNKLNTKYNHLKKKIK
jgi:hypothetical protein